jgi:hypothetical protein
MHQKPPNLSSAGEAYYEAHKDDPDYDPARAAIPDPASSLADLIRTIVREEIAAASDEITAHIVATIRAGRAAAASQAGDR